MSALRQKRSFDAPALGAVIARRGRPQTIVSDNRTEFTSMAILGCLKQTQNAFTKSFNWRLRDELPNETLLASLDHAREVLADWKEYYNTGWRHSAIGNVPPAVYANLSDPEAQGRVA